MTTDTPVTAPRNAGTTGRISLVGIGPGHTDHMTARARAAIAEADVVVGYVTYIKLVADLLDGKEVVRKGMTEELDRAVHALAAARAGKKVALISSGDAGVYGMAGRPTRCCSRPAGRRRTMWRWRSCPARRPSTPARPWSARR